MSDGTVAVLFGAITAVGYGLADFWAARASKTIGAITSLLAMNILMLSVYAPLYFGPLHPEQVINMSGVWFAVLGGVLLNAASILFFKGLVAGPVSIVSPISAAYPLVSAGLAVFAFNASLSIIQLAAIVVVVIGVMTASGLFSAAPNQKRLGHGPLLAMFSAVFYGSAFSCLAQASERIGWESTTFVEFCTMLPVLILSVPFVRGKEHVLGDLSNALRNRFVIMGGLMAVATIALFNMGFTYGKTAGAITIAVSACYPVVTVALALRHFKEEIRLIPLLGAGASVAGIVLLSLG